MKHRIVHLGVLASMIAILSFAFTNCSKPKHSPLIDPNLLATTAEDIQPETLKITSSDSYMNCDEDHVQLGGLCHPGEAILNYIDVSITRDRVAIPFGTGGATTYKLSNIKCENGRFFVVVPRPNDVGATCMSGNCAPEYRVESQFWLSDDGNQYRAGARGTSFPIRIELTTACTGT